jgi:putative ABC transport system permease protein
MNTLLDLRTRKVLRDVWGNKARAALVVLSIALGMIAVTTIFRTRTILTRDIAASYVAIHPASAVLFGNPPWLFTDRVVAAARRVPGVRAVQGRSVAAGSIRAGDRWLTLDLIAYDDRTDLQVNQLVPQTASWPPPDRTLLLERSAAAALRDEISEGTVTIRAPSGRLLSLPVAGTGLDLTVLPTGITGDVVYAYVTRNTLAWLGGQRDYNELAFTVADDVLDASHIHQVAGQVQRAVEDELQFDRDASPVEVPGPVNRIEVPPPNQPLLQPTLVSVGWLLMILAVSALVLSAFLVTNTITALLAQQVRQIGSMKAIGAPERDILAMYLGVVLIFAVIATLVSQPIGTLAAAGLSGMIGNQLNFDPHLFDVPAWHIAAEVAIGIGVPLIVALAPIRRALRITVREAMDDSGRSAGDGGGWIDRALERLHGLPSATLYALRNTFRNKGRLVLTLVTLSLGGAVVIAVINVAASIVTTLDGVRAYWQEDVTLNLRQPYSFNGLRQAVSHVPGVERVAGSLLIRAMHVAGTQDTNESLDLFGVQLDSNILTPTLLEGRWLTADDKNALVVNTNFAHQEEVRTGEQITLRLTDGKKRVWHVVGMVTSEVRGGLGPRPYSPVAGYVTYGELGQVADYTGQITRLSVVTLQHDTASQRQVAVALEDTLTRAGYKVVSARSSNDQLDQLITSLSSMLQLLEALAGLFSVVGGLGLLGAMSMNVLERTREVGVLRSIGIESGDLRSVVLTESLLIGLMSWVLACILSVPISIGLNSFLGPSILDTVFTFAFPLWAPVAWLALVLAIATVASLLPARSAARISVREALVYE